MCCIYFLQTAGLQCGHWNKEGHGSTHTLAVYFNLYDVCVCVGVCVCVCVSLHILAAVLSLYLTIVPLVEHFPFPSAPAPPFFVPRLAVLTGRVATVMDDCALGFSVRVLHFCYLPCGSLSKTSCQVSYTLPLLFSPSSSALPSLLYLAHYWDPFPKLEQSVKCSRNRLSTC